MHGRVSLSVHVRAFVWTLWFHQKEKIQHFVTQRHCCCSLMSYSVKQGRCDRVTVEMLEGMQMLTLKMDFLFLLRRFFVPVRFFLSSVCKVCQLLSGAPMISLLSDVFCSSFFLESEQRV